MYALWVGFSSIFKITLKFYTVGVGVGVGMMLGNLSDILANAS